IRVIHKHNGGLPSARNTGISASRGSFVAFLDADDWWLPEKIERQVALMRAHPHVGFCSTTAQTVSADGNPLGIWACPSARDNQLEAIFENLSLIPGSGSGVLVRHSLFRQAGLFESKLRSLEDVDMWMRLAAISGYACIPEALTVIRRSSNSMSRNLDVMRVSALGVLRKNRRLLAPGRRGRFWHACYASALSDYAKWEYRAGRRMDALLHLIEAFARAPITRGRLTLGLLAAVVRGETI
ncbi:MAG: glycosyltransferase family A protein, partial [Burkholderiales bacterium]